MTCPRVVRNWLAGSLAWLLVLLGPVAVGQAQKLKPPFDGPPRSLRTRQFDVKHTVLHLDLDWQEQLIRGRVIHHVVPFRTLRELHLDAAEMTVQQVQVSRQLAGPDPQKKEQAIASRFQTKGEQLIIALAEPVRPGEQVTIQVRYQVRRPRRGGHFVVPDRDEPSQARVFWTQSEPEQARYWFPCYSSPNDMLTSETLVTVPKDFFVLSNGVLKAQRELPSGRKLYHWVQRKPHVTYLISVVAGNFVAYKQQYKRAGEVLPIVSYVPPGRLKDAPRSFRNTPAMMKLFEQWTGTPYPWPKYAQICCDEYGGGMEHTSATTLTLDTLHDERAALDFSSEGLVAHELAHQWFGDLVTCKDWAELWLNESFATYFATLWFEHHQGRDEALWRLHQEAQSYMREDRRYRRPIVAWTYRRPWNMFDRHSYPKGGRVLHMLRYVVGDEGFRRGIQRYLQVNAHRTVETADFRTAMEEATGLGLTWFFRQWIYHGGHPQYRVRSSYDPEKKTLRLHIRQTQKVDQLTPLFRMPVQIAVTTPGGRREYTITVAKADEVFTFPCPQRPRYVEFDPRDWILKELDFEKSLQEWIAQLESPHVMSRYRAVVALGKHKEQPAARDALLEVLAKEKFWGVRQTAAGQLAGFGGPKVAQALRHAARRDAHSRVRREALAALRRFKGKETVQVLLEAIQKDRSYYAVAQALRTLAVLDRPRAAQLAEKLLPQRSHREVVLRAAVDVLVQHRGSQAAPQLGRLLKPPVSANRKAAVLSALGKATAGDPKAVGQLARYLNDPRRKVRLAAIRSLEANATGAALEALRTHRGREDRPAMVQALDDAIQKLENRSELKQLRQQVNRLQQQLRRVQQQLEKLAK